MAASVAAEVRHTGGFIGTALPDVGGDFFYGAEFEYVSKNGRDLRRTYDHDAQLNGENSARIITKVTIRNASEPGRFNESSISDLRVYEPQGAFVDEEAGDLSILEPEIAGHPAAGWRKSAAARGDERHEAPAIRPVGERHMAPELLAPASFLPKIPEGPPSQRGPPTGNSTP